MTKLLWPWHANTDLVCATPLLCAWASAAFVQAELCPHIHRLGDATLERPLRGRRRLETCEPTPNDHAAVRLGGE